MKNASPTCFGLCLTALSTLPLLFVACGGGNEDSAADSIASKSSAYLTCSACHGQNGKGTPVGEQLMAPSLIGSEMLLGDPETAILVSLKGLQKETAEYIGIMAPLSEVMDDQTMADALTYARNSWGNSADSIDAAQVAAVRAKFAQLEAPGGVKRSEIDKIVSGDQ